jgi:adenylate cyclase
MPKFGPSDCTRSRSVADLDRSMADSADLKGGSAGRSAPIDLAREADLRLGSALVRPSLSEVVAASQTIRLQPRVMQVLVALARADGEVVSRDELLASCWGGLAIGDDAINRCIGRLRRLSEEEAPGAFTIGTLPRIGYRLSQVADRASPPPAQGAVRKLSICVLPFANLSDDPQQEYFSDGISEDIITDLSKVSALSVVARNTAFTFKGKSVKIIDVARELGVSHVLEGSVRKAGNRVRITAELIDGAAGDHIWAERFDRDLTDIFSLQDEISEAIVAVLKLKLLPQEKQAIERHGTDSVEAYDLYLMARSYYLTGNYGDPRRDEAIERLSRRAVEIDPAYAQAWALLASGQYSLQSNHGRAGNGGQAALDRALALDPDLAEARALKALKLSEAGRHEEAAAEIAVALRLNPESYEVNWRAGSSSYNQGRLAEAVPYFEKATALETDTGAPMMLIRCYTALGDAENARRIAWVVLERAEKALARDRSSGNALGAGVAALAALGEADRAKDWMRRALLIDPDNLLMRYNFSCTLARSLGDDPEAALAMLGQVLERDTGRLVTAASTDPDFAGLRGDPRFRAMLAAAEARLAAGKPADGAGAPESAGEHKRS